MTSCELDSVVYDWDFSQGPQGFQEVNCDSVFSPGLWEYGWTARVSGAPSNVWGTVLNGEYSNSSGAGLLSPWFFVNEASRFVEVQHWFSTESGYDGCNVTAGAGVGSSNTVIYPIGGYTTSQINGSPSYYALCVDGEPGWTGPDATWRVDCFDLADFLNQWVRLEFDFGTDQSNTAPGWYISRVRVGRVGPPLGACCDLTSGTCSQTTQAECLGSEGGPREWHGDWSTCDPNPCPQPITHGEVAMAGWTGAEPWHNWVSSVPGSTVAIQVCPGALAGHITSVDFYVSTDWGWTWQHAGSDENGTEPHLNTTDLSVVPAGDGWSLTMPVPSLPPGTPLLYKALVHTGAGDRVAAGEASADPAPPSLGTTSVHDWVVTDRDTMGMEIQPNGTAVSRIVVFREAVNDQFVKGIPGIDQHILGNDYCAPTAAAQCLRYFEAQGDHAVTGGLADDGLVSGLSSYMNTTPVIGTSPSNWWGGLQSWIDDHGHGYSVRQFRHYDRWGDRTFGASDWRRMRNELERCQDVMVGVFWEGGGGHAMTLNAIQNTALPNGRILLGFMDPWTGQASVGELDPNTGYVYDMTGAGEGRTGYIGVTMIASPRESDVNQGGPGLAVYDGLPPGGPPYHVVVPLPDPGEWTLHVVLVNSLGDAYRSSYLVVRTQSSGAPDQPPSPPVAFAMDAAVPNPFHDGTNLTYTVPYRTTVDLAVFDVSGRRIRTLMAGEVEAGVHRVSWDGRDDQSRAVANGVYLVRMVAGTWSRTRTVARLR